ncbi:MAG: hypothetical protein IT438_03445 [Phycisphaerales bacterium]|nr:hypothetical protein [Phycisphaerales bacterium]
MRVYLDNEPVSIATPTLAAALAAVRESAEKNGRVVVEVLRDGQPVPQHLLEQPTDAEEPESEVRCATADPRSLVAESMRHAAGELAASRPVHTRAAEAIQTGRLEAAMPLLSETMTIWSQVYRVVVDGAALTGIGLGSEVGGRPLSQSVQDLAGRLAELKRALTAQDWSGLADSIGYDLPEQASHWELLLHTLSDRIAAGR